MKCPKDINREEFERVCAAAPDGARLERTRRVGWWRDLYFSMEGTTLILSVPILVPREKW